MESVVPLPWDEPLDLSHFPQIKPGQVNPGIVRTRVCGAPRKARSLNGAKAFCKNIPMRGSNRCRKHGGTEHRRRPKGKAVMALITRIEARIAEIVRTARNRLAAETFERMGILDPDPYIRAKGLAKLSDFIALDSATSGLTIRQVKLILGRLPGATTVDQVVLRLMLGKQVIAKAMEPAYAEMYGGDAFSRAWERQEFASLRKIIMEFGK